MSHAVLLVGLTGSGKTTLSRLLEESGLSRLSVDEEVHRQHGRYGVDYPEDQYLQEERPVVAETLGRLLEKVAAGHDVVLDHGLWTRAEREDWSAAVHSAGGQVLLVHLPASRDKLLRRLETRNHREDANALTVTPGALEDFIARFETPGDEEHVMTAEGEPDQIAAKVMARISVGTAAVSSPRDRMLRNLLEELRGVRPGERALVAVDGVDGAGKTCLAEELVAMAREDRGRLVLRVSIDGFHRPAEERRRAGVGAEGFYRGSYQYDAFRAAVVDPLREGRPIIPAVWDVAADRAVSPEPITLGVDDIVLVDGIFLQRPELQGIWDAVLWVDVPFEVSVPRGNARFPGRDEPDPESPANARYVGGQRLYLAEASPRNTATWVLDNRDLERPVLTRGQGSFGS